jgi:hypothetical protein
MIQPTPSCGANRNSRRHVENARREEPCGRALPRCRALGAGRNLSLMITPAVVCGTYRRHIPLSQSDSHTAAWIFSVTPAARCGAWFEQSARSPTRRHPVSVWLSSCRSLPARSVLFGRATLRLLARQRTFALGRSNERIRQSDRCIGVSRDGRANQRRNDK